MKKVNKTNKIKYILLVFFAGIGIFATLTLFVVYLGYEIKIFNRAVIKSEEYQEYLKLKKIINYKQEIDKKYYKEVDEDIMIEGAIRGLFAALPDGYSKYLSKEEIQRKNQRNEGESVGIGIEITKNENKEYEIVNVVKGRPAEKAGLKTGDIILSVNDISLNDINYEKALSEIRKDDKEFIVAGEYIKVKIVVKRGNEEIEFMVGRDVVIEKTVEYEIIRDIGYIKIASFIETTYRDYEIALDKLHEAKIEKLIIDLRDNGGGLVAEAEKIAGSILGKDKIIYYTSSKNIDLKEHFASRDKKYDFDVVVLVNESSASASELLVGALKHYKAATILGITTYGKGIIQTTYTLPKGDGFQITTSEYLTPNKDKIHEIGIKPDVAISLEVLQDDENKDQSVEYSIENDEFIKKAKELLNNNAE